MTKRDDSNVVISMDHSMLHLQVGLIPFLITRIGGILEVIASFQTTTTWQCVYIATYTKFLLDSHMVG